MRGGAGTALVGDGPTVAARMQEYADLGIDTFILSGYPHLEEAYRVGELLFPHLDLTQEETPARLQPVRPQGEVVANIYVPQKCRRAEERPDGKERATHPVSAGPWALPLALVILWQIAVETGWLSNRILPAPSAVLAAFWSLSQSGELWQHLSISSQRALIGFAIGGSIGLILGFITGLSRWGERLLDSSVQMIRNVPHLALIPLVILWFGIDESAKIFLVALGTLFPIYLNTYHGIKTSIAACWRWPAATA